MVQRLNSAQTKQIIQDLVPSGFTELRIPEPVSAQAILDFCVPLAESPVGRSYGLFSDGFKPVGFFLGFVCSDPMTGRKVGIEHIWWAAPKTDGRPLLARFESDCRAEGCSQVRCGFSEFVSSRSMERFYRRLGYARYSVSVMKDL